MAGVGGGTATASARAGTGRKVAHVKQGYSQMAWMRLSMAADTLCGFAKGAAVPKLTMAEVHKHNTKEDAWMVLHDKVYNVTPYMDFHPGGVEELMRGVGDSDATPYFDEVHPWVNIEAILGKACIGPLVRPRPEDAAAGAVAAAAAGRLLGQAGTEDLWQRVELLNRVPIGPDAELFRFKLPKPDMRLGLSAAGEHIQLRFVDDTEDPSQAAGDVAAATGFGPAREIIRPYTPVSPLEQRGTFDLAVRLYPKGRMSQHLASLSAGDTIEVRGPRGSLALQKGVALFGGRPRKVKQLLLAVGGSGVTVALQLARSVLAEAADETTVHVAYFNSAPDRVMLRRDLEQLADGDARIRVSFFVSRSSAARAAMEQAAVSAGASSGNLLQLEASPAPSPADAAAAAAAAGGETAMDWPPGVRAENGERSQYAVGRVGEDTLRAAWPAASPDQLVAWCGPPGFNAAADAAARSLYYASDSMFEF